MSWEKQMEKMKNNIEKLRLEYQNGNRVKLIRMDDMQAPPMGTKGTVMGVDDIGSILVSWDNGSHLNVVYGEDQCEKVITEKLKEQIETVRQTGLVNMLDARRVQQLAHEMNLYDLVIFIEEEPQEYFDFILTGK